MISPPAPLVIPVHLVCSFCFPRGYHNPIPSMGISVVHLVSQPDSKTLNVITIINPLLHASLTFRFTHVLLALWLFHTNPCMAGELRMPGVLYNTTVTVLVSPFSQPQVRLHYTFQAAK